MGTTNMTVLAPTGRLRRLELEILVVPFPRTGADADSQGQESPDKPGHKLFSHGRPTAPSGEARWIISDRWCEFTSTDCRGMYLQIYLAATIHIYLPKLPAKPHLGVSHLHMLTPGSNCCCMQCCLLSLMSPLFDHAVLCSPTTLKATISVLCNVIKQYCMSTHACFCVSSCERERERQRNP